MRSRRGVPGLMALAIGLTACSGGGPRTLIGVRKVSLALAFKDPALAKPPTHRVVVTVIPVPPVPIVPGPVFEAPPVAAPGLPPKPFVLPDLCPHAAPGATPAVPAAVAITTIPKEGVYYRHNVGTIKVTGGVIPLSLPYPLYSRVTISNVKRVESNDLYYGSEPVLTFEATEDLTPTLAIHTSYSANPRELDLVSQDVVSAGQVSGFHPTPAIEVMPFTGAGATWESSGIDSTAASAEVVQGAIDGARQIVDVCGTLVDTLKVSTTRHQAWMRDNAVNGSGNPDHPNAPDIDNYALQFGGLVVRHEEHSQRTVQSGSTPLTLQIDVVSTLLSIQPDARLVP